MNSKPQFISLFHPGLKKKITMGEYIKFLTLILHGLVEMIKSKSIHLRCGS
jgi:hypothetical protein